MREESAQSFPRPEQNNAELVHIYVKSELEKAGITLQRIGIDSPNKTCTVTTDIEVPEKIKSNICQFSDYKGIAIKFLTSG